MGDAVSISEAKTNLSKLIARAEAGEDVVIRRGATAVVRLVPVADPVTVPRSPIGALKGRIIIGEDFDELGPEWDPYR